MKMEKNVVTVLRWISIPIVTLLSWILSFVAFRLISSLICSEWYVFGIHFTVGLISAVIAVSSGFYASPKQNNVVLYIVASYMLVITILSFYFDNYIVDNQRLDSNLESIGQIIGIIIAIKTLR